MSEEAILKIAHYMGQNGMTLRQIYADYIFD